MTDDQKLALRAVLRYLWDDEQADYEANPDMQRGHIFVELQVLAELVGWTPE